MNFSVVEKNIGYRFKDRRLLMRALTLASYDNKSCNETLEFFGDAIIEFIVSEKIFALDADEGELTERPFYFCCRPRPLSDFRQASTSWI